MKKLEMIECEYVCDILLDRKKMSKREHDFFSVKWSVSGRNHQNSRYGSSVVPSAELNYFFHSKIFMCYPTLIHFRLYTPQFRVS